MFLTLEMTLLQNCGSFRRLRNATYLPFLQVTDQHLSILDVVWMMMMNDVTTTAANVLLFVQCDRSSQHSDIW